MPTVPEKPECTQVVDYTTEIQKTKKERDVAMAYMQHLKDIKDKETVETNIETYNLLCDALDPKGIIMRNTIGYYTDIFAATCNETAKKIRPGFEFKFFAKNGVTYEIKPDVDKTFMPFESLSSGEQLMALFVLMNMLSELTKVKIMMLDDLDKLDNIAFSELLDLITADETTERYDHIILGAVNHNDIVETAKRYELDNIYSY
jgi:hypothetical protein